MKTIEENNLGIEEFAIDKIDSIIDSSPYTIVYGWSVSCMPCVHYFKEEIVPFLANKPDSIGFISITYSSFDNVSQFFQKQNIKYPTFLCKGNIFSNGRDIFNCFCSITNDYQEGRVMGVPQCMFLNRKREVLNKYSYDTLLNHVFIENGDMIHPTGIDYEGVDYCIKNLEKLINRQ